VEVDGLVAHPTSINDAMVGIRTESGLSRTGLLYVESVSDSSFLRLIYGNSKLVLRVESRSNSWESMFEHVFVAFFFMVLLTQQLLQPE
jgi:hypothetical protein